MTKTIAVVRDVSSKIADCQLTHLQRVRIDAGKARAQHADYKALLTGLGARLVELGGGEAFPDGAFVEDLAVVVDEAAVVNRPGAESRRGEVEGLADLLKAHRPIRTMTSPATLDGGDVMQVGRTLFVGKTARTNDAGRAQLAEFLRPYGYRVQAVEIRGCLHLKSACTYLGRNTVLLNRAWVDASNFSGLELLDVDPSEPSGGNAVHVGDAVVYSTVFPKTSLALQNRGFDVRATDNSELMKAESALTCMSILFQG